MKLFIPNNTALTLLLLFSAAAISSCEVSENGFIACKEQAYNEITDEDKKLFSLKEDNWLREGRIDKIFEEFSSEDPSSEDTEE